MTREEAIHYLERIKNEYDCSYEEDALAMAIRALEQEPKWIPVSERLPDDEEDVLFCDLFGDIMLGYHPRDWKSTHFAERGSCEFQKNVAAWMPLPKPYEP